MDVGKLPQGLHPTKNVQTGEIVLPNTEKYGEYSDQESWFDWQARNQLGPDTDASSKRWRYVVVFLTGYLILKIAGK